MSSTDTEQQGTAKSGQATSAKRKRERFKGRVSVDPDAADFQPVSTGPKAGEPAEKQEDDRGAAPAGEPEMSTVPTATEEHPGEKAASDAPTEEHPESSPAPDTARDTVPALAEDPSNWKTALDDPAIVPGKSDYRSFYVEDSAFARWRAAIYWNARNPQTRGVIPKNMSEALAQLFRDQAAEWEKRFNNGNMYPPTDEQVDSYYKRVKEGRPHKRGLPKDRSS